MKMDLTEQARKLKNENQQRYRNANPEARERARAYQRKYYKNLSPEEKKSINIRLRKWRKENSEKVGQHNIAYWNKKAVTAVTDKNVTDKEIISVTNVTTCLECGKPFSGRAGAKFCNSTCRQRNHRKKKCL
jgi:hypothetical protein